MIEEEEMFANHLFRQCLSEGKKIMYTYTGKIYIRNLKNGPNFILGIWKFFNEELYFMEE